MPRIKSRDILPTAVKSRNLSEVIFGSVPDEVQTTLANGEQVVITFSINQNRDYELLGNLYFTIYVGSVAVNNQLPGGSSVNETQWQIIGPYFDYNEWEAAGFPEDKDFITIYILNISAGSSDLIIQSRWKYISPREGNA